MASWFSFSLFLKISAVTYTTACARAYGFVFERHQRSNFFVEKLYGMRVRVLSKVHACPRARRRAARDGLVALGVLGGSAAKWTNVVWPIKRRQTNQQTNQQTNTHYSFIGIDIFVGFKALTCYSGEGGWCNRLALLLLRNVHATYRLTIPPEVPPIPPSVG